MPSWKINNISRYFVERWYHCIMPHYAPGHQKYYDTMTSGVEMLGHSISDVQVRGVALCSGTNIRRKQHEMRLIFQLGTVQPKGMNINFSFIWIGTLYTSCAPAPIIFMSIILRSTVQRFFSHTEEGPKTRNACVFGKHLTLFDISLPSTTLSATGQCWPGH